MLTEGRFYRVLQKTLTQGTGPLDLEVPFIFHLLPFEYSAFITFRLFSILIYIECG